MVSILRSDWSVVSILSPDWLPLARYNYTWTVPLTLQTDAGTELQLVLTHENISATHIQVV